MSITFAVKIIARKALYLIKVTFYKSTVSPKLNQFLSQSYSNTKDMISLTVIIRGRDNSKVITQILLNCRLIHTVRLFVQNFSQVTSSKFQLVQDILCNHNHEKGQYSKALSQIHIYI